MKPWLAILFAIGLILFCMVATAFSGYNIVAFMIIVTSLWAAIDSSKMELQKYRSGISYKPAILFFAIAFLWILGFPWYLIVRYRIRNGTATLKNDFPCMVSKVSND
ncbi:hypothetical protein [Duganella vulcania]|uniref:Uncharacterized protein n=1 Tax=Duganella vulcania TaxID=2692166 RepID=A0A845GVY5_9BURK|nr:hypothetical protein [Duganella vulcania]MYM98191.1 hypothetical protein [Duganella vulcania]